MVLGPEHNKFLARRTFFFLTVFFIKTCVPVSVCVGALLPRGQRLCVLSSSNALAPHSSSRSSMPSLLSSPSQDTLWTGLCSER